MPRMGGNYGSYEGGSGLADLLSGAVSGFRTGSDLAAQRAAQKLAEEREARYEKERLAQEEARARAEERQAALDAMQGILPSGSVDMNEQVVTASGAPAREALNLAASASRGLSSLAGGGVNADLLEMSAKGVTDKTENRYQQVGDRAIDRTRYDAGLKRRMGEEETRQTEGRERRALLSLTNPDGTPMLRNEEVLGRSGKGLEAISGRASTMGLDRRIKAEDQTTEWGRQDEVYDRNRENDLKDAKEIGRFNSGLRIGEYERKSELDAANAPAFDVKRAASLRTEYRVRTSDFAKQAQALGRIRAAADNPDPQGADDVALIFNYMKMLDPTSVVRESEYATAANTGLSVPENVRRQYNKALEGKVLSPKQRQDMLASALRQGEGARRQLQEMSAYYSGLAAQEGIPPDNVVYDYFGGVDAPEERQGQQVAAYKSRVRELVNGGMDLDQAKAKARAEMED